MEGLLGTGTPFSGLFRRAAKLAECIQMSSSLATGSWIRLHISRPASALNVSSCKLKRLMPMFTHIQAPRWPRQRVLDSCLHYFSTLLMKLAIQPTTSKACGSYHPCVTSVQRSLSLSTSLIVQRSVIAQDDLQQGYKPATAAPSWTQACKLMVVGCKEDS